MEAIAGRLRVYWTVLAAILGARSVAYWTTAAAVLASTLWAEPFIDKYTNLNLSAERNWLFQHLTQSVTNPTSARNVKVVIIRDDEYWDGDLHHRVPTDRAYLARLLRALDTADASVIALDFDERLPHTGAPGTLGDYGEIDSYKPYRDETDELVRAIGEIAERRKIVLSKTIDGPTDGPFRLGGDIFQPYGICTKLIGDGQWLNPGTPQFKLSPVAQKNISCGYIRLMDDRRRVPPPAKITGQSGVLDAFPLAIVRARAPDAVPALQDHSYYVTYVTEKIGDDPRIVVSAHDLFHDPQRAKWVVQGWPVIVGAGWNQRAAGSGDLVDMHDTPIGPVSGTLIHENLAEAVLSRRAFPSLPELALKAIEIVVGVAAAIVFSLFSTQWLRFAAVLVSMLVLFAIQWLVLQVFGAFLDAFIPVFGLGLHAIAAGLTEEH